MSALTETLADGAVVAKRNLIKVKRVPELEFFFDEAIERGDFPKWKLYIQVMPEADAENYRFHPFDLTKVWSKKDYPLIEVGEWELNRNPDNYFAEVEQAAFTPANLIPGISFSPDRMLQGRLF